MPSPKGAKHHRVNQDAYARVIKELVTEPCSLRHLVDVTGLHLVTLYRLFRVFKKYKLVHVSAWEPDSRGRDAHPVFTFGEGRDKPKYKMTQAQIAQRYREKQKRKKAAEALDKIIKGVPNENCTDTEPCFA